jgi:ferric-dicitrate binding protein FerR (iron transport regulator)
MEQKQAKELLDRYLEGRCSPNEADLVESWYLRETENPQTLQSEPDYEGLGKSMWKDIQRENNQTRKVTPYYKWAAVAAFAIIGLGLYHFANTPTAAPVQSAAIFYKHDIAPGKNKAFLTLADGSRIALDDANNGKIADQAGVTISKTADGQLLYQVSDSAKPTQAGFNTVETPKGGQYQVNLPDGTKVWLNAGSSLRYPAQFALNKRRVELKGEAYFEVAKRTVKGNGPAKRLPFIVKTNSQEVEVLGTHFNINSYQEEGDTRTTLLEGSVAVHSLSNAPKGLSIANQILKPGEQSTLRGESIKVATVDTEQVMAWKEGFFMFDDENLQSIMHKVARWYDVEVDFKDNSLKTKSFSGTVSRFSNVSQLLKKIELTGSVHFKIEERRIVVMR